MCFNAKHPAVFVTLKIKGFFFISVGAQHSAFQYGYMFRSFIDHLQENIGLKMVWKVPKHVAILGCCWLCAAVVFRRDNFESQFAMQYVFCVTLCLLVCCVTVSIPVVQGCGHINL
jgi:hypothetical protein